MKLKLKEDPREWRKFGWVLSLFLALLSVLWQRKHPASTLPFRVGLGLAAVTALASALRPRSLRSVYGAAMRFSFVMGGFSGKILLAVLYVFALVPLALLLRVLGKDLLQRRRPTVLDTYWSKPAPPGPLDRLF